MSGSFRLCLLGTVAGAVLDLGYAVRGELKNGLDLVNPYIISNSFLLIIQKGK